jgi:transglutaminase-like putative cysteine protease
MEPIGDFKLPTTTLWADAATLDPLKMESEMPTFGGKMTVVRTTKEAALRPVGKVPDLFDVQSVKLDRVIADVHNQASVTYRVKLASDLPADKAFKADARQAVKNADAAAKTFELVVTAVRGPVARPDDPVPAAKEFLSDCFFIDWDNPQTRQLAQQAVANLPADASAWQKARAVESYVHNNMRATEFSQAMATCSNVAKSLSGDCTEYAMLAVGMCRALGVPSRTALGLVYATDRMGKPFLAYHMWFEVHVEGQWVALDATLGRGSVGPGHLKITDASWHDEKSFAPLLPVLSVLSAQPQVEVARVAGR